MIELDYFLPSQDTGVSIYQLIQFSQDDPWRIVLDGELLGSIEKSVGAWRQLTGETFSVPFFKGVAAFIDKQNFNNLPSALRSRWANLIDEVVVKSDQEYLVICRAGVSFRSFEGIFSRFVSGLLKDEWPVNFRVFNHDFSQDFTLLAKPVISKKTNVGWD